MESATTRFVYGLLAGELRGGAQGATMESPETCSSSE
jgi:hypothetical protein